MKIEINLKIVFAIILFFIFNNLNMYLIFLFFVLIHEMSHLIVGLMMGGKAEKIYITPFGVSLEIYSYGRSSSLNKILFYLSGPLINLILAFIFFYSKIDIDFKEEIIYTNVAICFFNLLPILPLDGGKILKEIFYILFKEKSNDIIIVFSKIFLGIISSVYSILIIQVKNIYILILLIYLWYLYFVEENKYLILKKTREEIKKYKNMLK